LAHALSVKNFTAWHQPFMMKHHPNSFGCHLLPAKRWHAKPATAVSFAKCCNLKYCWSVPDFKVPTPKQPYLYNQRTELNEWALKSHSEAWLSDGTCMDHIISHTKSTEHIQLFCQICLVLSFTHPLVQSSMKDMAFSYNLSAYSSYSIHPI
jgi:hypothetical protein